MKAAVLVVGVYLFASVIVPWAMAKGGPNKQASLKSVTPSIAAPGQTLSVTLGGDHLNTVTALDFGAGITVNSFSSNSAKKITANLTVDGAAALGLRDVKLTTLQGTVTSTNAFSVSAVTGCTNVNVSTTPGSVTFDKIGRQRKINLIVQNLSGSDITVASIVTQTNSYKIHQISPPAPRLVKAGKSRSFNIRVRGDVIGTFSAPFFEVTIQCGAGFAVVQAAEENSSLGEEITIVKADTRFTGSTQIELFSLSGQSVILSQGDTVGALDASALERVANGVYLTVVTTLGVDGAVLSREVRKLIVKH
jgi:hypothetical protein